MPKQRYSAENLEKRGLPWRKIFALSFRGLVRVLHCIQSISEPLCMDSLSRRRAVIAFQHNSLRLTVG
jgi:hypothetical protein